MTVANQGEPVRPTKQGLGTTFKALWSLMTTILSGLEAYASAFKKVGEVMEMTADNYKAEAALLHEQEMQALRDEK